MIYSTEYIPFFELKTILIQKKKNIISLFNNKDIEKIKKSKIFLFKDPF